MYIYLSVHKVSRPVQFYLKKIDKLFKEFTQKILYSKIATIFINTLSMCFIYPDCKKCAKVCRLKSTKLFWNADPKKLFDFYATSTINSRLPEKRIINALRIFIRVRHAQLPLHNCKTVSFHSGVHAQPATTATLGQQIGLHGRVNSISCEKKRSQFSLCAFYSSFQRKQFGEKM